MRSNRKLFPVVTVALVCLGLLLSDEALCQKRGGAVNIVPNPPASAPAPIPLLSARCHQNLMHPDCCLVNLAGYERCDIDWIDTNLFCNDFSGQNPAGCLLYETASAWPTLGADALLGPMGANGHNIYACTDGCPPWNPTCFDSCSAANDPGCVDTDGLRLCPNGIFAHDLPEKLHFVDSPCRMAVVDRAEARLTFYRFSFFSNFMNWDLCRSILDYNAVRGESVSPKGCVF